MHKTQGLGGFRGRGDDGARMERFSLLDGAPVTNDIMDGVNTTWDREPAGAAIGRQADDIIAHFDSKNPSASVPALMELRSKLAALVTDDPVVAEKRSQLDRIIGSCLGLEATTVVSPSEVVPGESMKLQHVVTIHSDTPVRWIAVRYPANGEEVKVGA